MLGQPAVLSSLPPDDGILSAEGGIGIEPGIQPPLTLRFEIERKKGVNLLYRPRTTSISRSARPSAQAVEQLAQHLLLPGGGDPARVEHALGAEAIDQDKQLMGGEINVHAVGKFALRPRLNEVTAQPPLEPVEFRVLHLTQLRVA